MRRLVLFVLIAILMVGEFAPGMAYGQLFQQQQVQQPRKRTLFDMLFGPREPQPMQVVPAPGQPTTAPRRTAPPTPPPPAKPAVPKAANATRVLVIGDSLAVDLGKALERFYAEDPNLAVFNKAIGSSGFVRTDYYDWTKTVADHIAANDFDVAVVMIGINDRQTLKSDTQSLKALTEGWTTVYKARLAQFLNELRAAGKPVIWVGLPPMQAPQFSAAMAQLSGIQRLAAFSGGADFIDIFERFADDSGNYASYGPDINGQRVRMRNSDGIHFTTAGNDKLAFYVSQALKVFYRGAGGLAVTDPLQGTDADAMLRPPYQGLGAVRLLQVAGAVVSLTNNPSRADQLLTATSAPEEQGFSLEDMVKAPKGRVDAFGVGFDPQQAGQDTGGH